MRNSNSSTRIEREKISVSGHPKTLKSVAGPSTAWAGLLARLPDAFGGVGCSEVRTVVVEGLVGLEIAWWRWWVSTTAEVLSRRPPRVSPRFSTSTFVSVGGGVNNAALESQPRDSFFPWEGSSPHSTRSRKLSSLRALSLSVFFLRTKKKNSAIFPLFLWTAPKAEPRARPPRRLRRRSN